MENVTEKLPVFIVNLRQDVAKRDHMQALCESYQLSVEFIQAVDGRLLRDAEIKASYSKAHALKELHRELSRSEIGCALSHKKIYRKIADESISRALILEDDVVFDEDLLKVLAGVNRFPGKWNIVLLGHHSDKGRSIQTHYSFLGKEKLNKKYSLTRPTECGSGTYGYILKLEAAKTLLRELDVIYKPIDFYTGVDQKLNLYTVTPAVIMPHQYLSDHFHSMHERNEIQNSPNLNKKTTIKRRILNVFHLHKIAVKLRNEAVKIKHRVKIPRRYR